MLPRKEGGYASRRQSLNDMRAQGGRAHSAQSGRGGRTASAPKRPLRRGSETPAPARAAFVVKLSSVVPAKPVEKLSVVERSITQIDSVRKDLQQRVEILFISGNLLKTLEGIQQFEKLRVLSAGNNSITTLEGLRALGPLALPNLATVNLQGNPVTQLPYYRLHMLHLCPKLTSLDGKEVTARERGSVTTALDAERAMLVELYVRSVLLQRCRHAVAKVKLHNEFHSILASKGGTARRNPSSVSLEKFLVTTMEMMVWYQPFDAAVPTLRMQVRKARLVKMAATSSDKDTDSHMGWAGAYNDVLQDHQASISDELSRLQANISTSFGVNFEELEDVSITDTVKQLVLQLSEMHERGELLSGSARHSGVTSSASLPPQQADPGTPADAAAPLTVQKMQEVDERQQRAMEKHKQRLSRRGSGSSADPASHASQASAPHDLLPPARARGVPVATPAESEPRDGSVSPTMSLGRVPSEISGISRAEIALHVSDEVRLQQVNEALRSKLEEYQRSNEKTASAARHYKGLLQEVLQREASLKEEVGALREAEAEQHQLVLALRTAAADLEVREADTVADMETRHAQEADTADRRLEEANAKIATLQRECDTLNQRLTRYRNDGRIEADQRRSESDDEEGLSDLLTHAKQRLLVRRTFATMRRAAARAADNRRASAFHDGMRRRKQLRGAFTQWLKQTFVACGERSRAHEVRLTCFSVWYDVASRKALSRRRADMERAWHSWKQRQRSRQQARLAGGSRPATPTRHALPASHAPDSTSRRLFVRRPSRRLSDASFRLPGSVPPSPSARVAPSPAQAEVEVLPRRSSLAHLRGVGHTLHNQRADRLSSESSEEKGDYMSPQHKQLAETKEARRRLRDRSVQAMHWYVQRLKMQAFRGWRATARKGNRNREKMVATHFSAWRHATYILKMEHSEERVADAFHQRQQRNVLRRCLTTWSQSTAKRALLRRVESSCGDRLRALRLTHVFSRWKSAGIAKLLHSRLEKEQLQREVNAQKEKVTTLGLSNMRLVDSLSEVVKKTAELEVDLEAKKLSLKDLTKSVNAFKASKKAMQCHIKGVENAKTEEAIKVEALLKEAVRGAEELTDHQTRQLLVEAASSKKIGELSSDLHDAKSGLTQLHDRLRLTQHQLEDAHETGAATTTAMVSLTAQLRNRVQEQEDVITTLDVQRLQQEKAQETYQRELVETQRRLLEGQTESSTHLHTQQEKLHGLRQQIIRTELERDRERVTTKETDLEVRRLRNEVRLMEAREWEMHASQDAHVVSPDEGHLQAAADTTEPVPRVQERDATHTMETSGEVEELLKRARRAKEQLSFRESQLRRQHAEVLIRGPSSSPSRAASVSGTDSSGSKGGKGSPDAGTK